MTIWDMLDQQQDPFALGNGGGLGNYQPPIQMPEPPTDPFKYGRPPDVSGFANYGMQPPAIEDPMQRMQGIMSLILAGDPHQASKEDPFMQMPQGGLMQYLMSLGV